MTILNEFESKQFLKEIGINIPKGEIAKIENLTNDIYRIKDNIKANQYVLKIVSQELVHKSDAGGVILNVPNYRVIFECKKMINNITNKFPNAKIAGIYIQEMVPLNGLEILIGIKHDEQFGKVIMFGSGGIFVEIYKDVSMRILPIMEDEIKEMIRETKIYKILSGFRGKQYDINSIVDVIMKIIQLSEEHNIQEMDINPAIVYEQGIMIVDARIKL